MDRFSAHMTDAVFQAALAKHYILLIIPGGLTGDVQPCDTELNKAFKTKYKELEQTHLLRTLALRKYKKKRRMNGSLIWNSIHDRKVLP